jgi:hypothetical protein
VRKSLTQPFLRTGRGSSTGAKVPCVVFRTAGRDFETHGLAFEVTGIGFEVPFPAFEVSWKGFKTLCIKPCRAGKQADNQCERAYKVERFP